jgi:hypothetical protein
MSVAALDPKDDIAIRRVLSEYCFCLDQGRFSDLGAMFTDDGLWQAGYGRAIGPEAICRFLTDLIPASPKRRHFVANAVIDPAGAGEATVLAYYLVVRESAQGPAISVAGTYEDRLRQMPDGSWKFVSRILKPEILGDLGLMR